MPSCGRKTASTTTKRLAIVALTATTLGGTTTETTHAPVTTIAATTIIGRATTIVRMYGTVMPITETQIATFVIAMTMICATAATTVRTTATARIMMHARMRVTATTDR